MPRPRIPKGLRQQVINRAEGCCEYCLVPQEMKPESHQIDHLIALKHGGRTVSSNCALACANCNLHKGSDVATVDPVEQVLVSLFNPRTHRWQDHFEFVGEYIVGRTAIGRATAELLRLNAEERLLERRALISLGRYPLL